MVDDHRLLAQAIGETLAFAPGIEVVGVEDRARAGIRAVGELRPDVVLMDFYMPDLDGASATRQILAISPDTKVVMVTGSLEETVLVEAVAAGCVGYVYKGRDLRELVETVRAAHRGEMLVSPDVLGRVLRRVRARPVSQGVRPTKRELEVLRLLARGASNEAIARRLGLSVLTVRKHVQNIIRKLGAHSKLEAVAVAVRSGLIEVE